MTEIVGVVFVTEAPPKKSDLGTRTLSAIVMLAVAGTALWAGDLWWTLFAFLVGLGVLREWITLSNAFAASAVTRLVWGLGGTVYCGLATTALIILRDGPDAVDLFAILAAVIATDVGAYFAGRTIGGPKIAPSISPSKTWAGLIGGMFGAVCGIALVLYLYQASRMAAYDPTRMAFDYGPPVPPNYWLSLVGVLIAIVAQAGDFFESWMKRRAGVKDSSHLIPGHGGLFDRVDGLIAVCFGIGLFMIITVASTLLSGGSLLPTPA